MSVAHPYTHKQKKARARKTRAQKMRERAPYIPPAVKPDAETMPAKPPRMTKRQRDAAVMAAIAKKTGLPGLYAAMGGYDARY